ncbi:MAG: triose-phosphate isomerase [Bacillota bacterium]|nr:triose-phosphate isomerase [Bacillota bacterium]
MRYPIIAGNWKMHMTKEKAKDFVAAVAPAIAGSQVEAVICAPFVYLPLLVECTQGTSIGIGAQNMHFEDQGAFTGEVSADMLLDWGVRYVIIGHSERRQYFAETDETVNRKVKKALEKGLTPILCCGETLEQREAGSTKDLVKSQILAGLRGVESAAAPKVVIAYEPIWAIGTGKTASAADANDVISYIRTVLEEQYGNEVSEEIRIQYGGSVKPDNVEELMNQTDIDGALVGGASLKPDDYIKLVNF